MEALLESTRTTVHTVHGSTPKWTSPDAGRPAPDEKAAGHDNFQVPTVNLGPAHRTQGRTPVCGGPERNGNGP